jgi:hypothetical protein
VTSTIADVPDRLIQWVKADCTCTATRFEELMGSDTRWAPVDAASYNDAARAAAVRAESNGGEEGEVVQTVAPCESVEGALALLRAVASRYENLPLPWQTHQFVQNLQKPLLMLYLQYVEDACSGGQGKLGWSEGGVIGGISGISGAAAAAAAAAGDWSSRWRKQCLLVCSLQHVADALSCWADTSPVLFRLEQWLVDTSCAGDFGHPLEQASSRESFGRFLASGTKDVLGGTLRGGEQLLSGATFLGKVHCVVYIVTVLVTCRHI